MSVLSIALALFLIANPIGTIPVFVSLVKDFDRDRQRQILLREAIFSMILAYLFLYVGSWFLNTIHIEQYSIKISGGILVLLVSLQMIFPHHEGEKEKGKIQEPFLVPIATPLISGGGVFATICVFATQSSYATMSLAIAIAWAFVIAIVVSSAYLQTILKKRGLIVMEQLMGMILLMLSVELISTGVHIFMQHLH